MTELNVLLVEDNDDDRFLATRAMKKLSRPVRLEIARDGAEALRRLVGDGTTPAPQLPALVILDLQLPRLNGSDVLARLRHNPATRELPVVIASSSDNPDELDRCRELGAASFIVKPLDAAKLEALFATLAV
ncbi:response regulator [Geobacter sp.]|uniref:response regulator n=1 Tax=Geobacter sp. TaxID=46610 RepID=UPI002602A9D5|nr:response regulator [Geobacter sp.]